MPKELLEQFERINMLPFICERITRGEDAQAMAFARRRREQWV